VPAKCFECPSIKFNVLQTFKLGLISKYDFRARLQIFLANLTFHYLFALVANSKILNIITFLSFLATAPYYQIGKFHQKINTLSDIQFGPGI